MDGLCFLLGLLFFGAFSAVVSNKAAVEFSECDLPYKLHINRSNDYEFHMGKKSTVTVSGATFDVADPFKKEGSETVTLDKCVDFVEIKVYVNEKGKDAERIVLHRCKRCNRTESRNGTDLSPLGITGIVTGVILFVLVLIVGPIVYFCCINREALMQLRGRALPLQQNGVENP
ncbi:hypothetical protein WMY93_030572 [Mugilogobius chulae]|uniref:Uncharacterized protein n=1 Tax=Mugilogobius chulae TaxID=88201 RepID=A0AAW0MMM9_9GOBI